MTETMFPAGERATLDLRDSSGTITLKDGEAGTIRIASEGQDAPFVLQEGETFRVRIAGGTVAVPAGLAVEAAVPPTVQLRVERDGREADTVVRPVSPAGTTPGTSGESDERPAAGEIPDLNEFTRVMSESAQRIFADMTRAVRASNLGFGDEIASRLDKAAQRIDEEAKRVAERVQREVERANETVGRAQSQARHAASRAEARAQRVAERMEHRTTRHEERAARRASSGRGRWWFADRLEEWAAANGGQAPGATTSAAPRPTRDTTEERRAILAMLAEGKITSEQASQLLDALG